MRMGTVAERREFLLVLPVAARATTRQIGVSQEIADLEISARWTPEWPTLRLERRISFGQ